MKDDALLNVRAMLFARWISTCYADEHLDKNMRHQSELGFDEKSAMSVLTCESGSWWKKALIEFNETAWPNYVSNGTVKSMYEFLKDVK